MAITQRTNKAGSGGPGDEKTAKGSAAAPADSAVSSGVASTEEGAPKDAESTTSEPAKVDAKAAVETSSKDPGAHENFFYDKRFLFIFGIVLGLVLAGYFHAVDKHPDMFKDIDAFEHVNKVFDDWKTALPQSLQTMMDESEQEDYHDPSASFAIGKYVRKQHPDWYPKHNVIIVPGTTTSGIESWTVDGVEGCPTESYFRKRLWGSFFMVKTIVLDKDCWLKNVLLDPQTGLDPPGIKLRAAEGFDAADYFITGYWIWSKILQNMAVIGYNPDNMYLASYDWRLAYLDLEIRDGYFSKLKKNIEFAKKWNGEKSVLMGHSMGAQIVFYFLKWVEASGEHFGNGGKHWVNDNIEAFVDISGCLLGTPKATVALISGEMKDTIQMKGLAMQALEKFFSRSERTKMLHSWGGIPSMLPKGGDLIWGDLNGAPDDFMIGPNENLTDGTMGNFLRFTENRGNFSDHNLTIAQSLDYLYDQSPDWWQRRMDASYSTGFARSERELKQNEKDPSKWINPLEVALPNAPDMKVFCFYGVGKPTERAYYYKEEIDKDKVGLNISVDMDRDVSVLFGEGDGTISIVTHTMCHKWQQKGHNMYNPGNSNVTIVEIKHEPDRFDIRGGSKTADHVDILGSAEMNELLLTVASGHGNEIANKYVTPLNEWAVALDATTF